MEERIVELEVRLAYQDKLIADLDEVLRSFVARVEALEREVRDLKATAVSPLGQHEDETPPHY
jgi:SlyX protein